MHEEWTLFLLLLDKMLSSASSTVYFKQFYLGCLAHASYLIGDSGEAAVIDPQRDVDQYLDEAGRENLRIKYVIETHLHADFVSGHRELAARTGAQIVIGAEANAAFPHFGAREGDALRLGTIELRALETPGHTPESICWLLLENGKPAKVITGDTLFIGDVGRPDLTKLLMLPDDVGVWPAHGAGSACGRNISKETSSTIGMQRRMNHALQPMSRDDFVKMMTTDLAPPPPYFARDAEINRRGARSLVELTSAPLLAEKVREEINRGALLLDVRDPAMFGAGHIAGAINIGLGGEFASWCGTLLPAEAPLVVCADSVPRASEAVMRLARVGIESALGFVTSAEEFDRASIPQITVSDLRERRFRVLDVRRKSEYEMGHVPSAQHIPLDELPRRISEVAQNGPLAVICASGYRSSIASSLLQRERFPDVLNVMGGTAGWVRAGYAVES
ncbi:MAG: MBL fold metallo-hydrolase [Acidobacteria bacterium]|nr:MAG: MBL fold metallo-hydrolase [Acidobacteriota bacterium]